MKIVVPIKQVAVLDDDVELSADGRGIDVDSVERSLNEWDAFSTEAALGLQERHGGEVVVVSVGDEEADEGLLACLANGATRAVRVWDDGLDVGDPLSAAHVLARVIEREQPDLVLCGAQSSDLAHGATGVALAAKLGLPHVAMVSQLEAVGDGRRLTVGRELEGGLVQRLVVDLPALLTIQTGLNKPRYANLRAIKQAREKPMEILSLSDLDLDLAAVEAAAGARVRAVGRPAKQGGAQMLEGSAADVAGRIADLIRDRVPA
jgi:electron transfer flavoprotein beta subunit